MAYASSALEATNVEGVIQAADPPHMGLVPDGSVIHAIWDALLNAENPLLVCGPDIGAAGAEEEILALAERLALPVATGIFDYASFPAHHPNYVGGRRGSLRGELRRRLLHRLPAEHPRQCHRPPLP